MLNFQYFFNQMPINTRGNMLAIEDYHPIRVLFFLAVSSYQINALTSRIITHAKHDISQL